MFKEALKVMGYVDKFNCGISKVKTELEKNGNPPPLFDVNKRTEFRDTLRPVPDIGDKRAVISPNGEINGEINLLGEIPGPLNVHSGTINGTIKVSGDKTDEPLSEPLNVLQET